jgi:hypothetical protein
MPDTATEAAVQFNPIGAHQGTVTTTRDTLLIRVSDGERVPIEANVERKIHSEVELGDRKGYLVTYQGQAHILVADTRATDPRWLAEKTTPVELRIGGSVKYAQEV